MPYSFDMSEEKAPKKKFLLPEGTRFMTVASMKDSVSKAGNEQIVFTLTDDETKNEVLFFCPTAKGKRWNLKMILEACETNPESWESKDVIGKKVIVTIEHEDNEYIDREGNKRQGKQHRITQIDKSTW